MPHKFFPATDVFQISNGKKTGVYPGAGPAFSRPMASCGTFAVYKNKNLYAGSFVFVNAFTFCK